MALDRAAVVARADVLIGQGKIDQAIEEYLRLLEEQPTDVSAANTLGDLYVRRGHGAKAVEQFVRLADAERSQGFTSKAVALYKKALKVDATAERVLTALAEIAAGQELFADATLYLNRLLQAQRSRGDGRSVADTLSRLASLPASSIDTRLAAAKAVDEHVGAEASARFFGLAAAALDAAGRLPEAVDAWLEAASRTTDLAVRRGAAECCLRSGAPERADGFLTLDVAGDHADLLWAVAERAAAANDEAVTRTAGSRFLAVRPDESGRVEALLARWTAPEKPADTEDAWPAIDLDTVFSNASADPPAVAIDAMGALSSFEASAPTTAAVPPNDGPEPAGGDEILIDLDEFLVDESPAVASADPAPLAEAAVTRPLPVEAPAAPTASPSTAHTKAVPAPRPAPVPPSPEVERSEPVVRVAAPVVAPAKPKPAVEAAASEPAAETVAQELAPSDEPTEGGAADLVAQLELAAQSPGLRFQAAAQLGRLYVARGRWADAITWLDAASEVPTSARDHRLAVLYDLADALERTGDVARAATVWSDLELESGSYRDVAARLARLARHSTAANR